MVHSVPLLALLLLLLPVEAYVDPVPPPCSPGCRNLVLGAVVGLPPSSLVPALPTLRRWCPPSTTHVVVASDGTGDALGDLLRRFGVQAIAPATDAELGGHPQQTRYWAFEQYLVVHGNRFDYVFIMDMADVVVQADPFRWPVPASIPASLPWPRLERAEYPGTPLQWMAHTPHPMWDPMRQSAPISQFRVRVHTPYHAAHQAWREALHASSGPHFLLASPHIAVAPRIMSCILVSSASWVGFVFALHPIALIPRMRLHSWWRSPPSAQLVVGAEPIFIGRDKQFNGKW